MRRLVASRALPPGAAVPSVRDLARDLSVNPATVARAYQRLADAGIFAVRRGDGTYVADSPPAPPAGERRRALREGATRYASLAVTLGATSTEARAATAGGLDQSGDGREERRQMNEDPVLALEQLTVRYGPAVACESVTLSVPRGAVYTLLGRNGAGKSSLVRCALGQQRRAPAARGSSARTPGRPAPVRWPVSASCRRSPTPRPR